MDSWHISDLPSVRRQQLLVEYYALKNVCPRGIYMCPAPGDPTVWYGVMFIREGPYASAILRFQITFPLTYPQLPPLVTFSTDMFHPLITPLTTNMYTNNVQYSDTVSATDEDLLPPGAFSLRHGFPHLFEKKTRKYFVKENEQTSSSINKDSSLATTSINKSDSGSNRKIGINHTSRKAQLQEVGIYEIIKYICSTFNDENILDRIPLSAAGNPGAWHAWRTYRIKKGKINTHVIEEPNTRLESLGSNDSDRIANIDRNQTSSSTESEKCHGKNQDETSLPNSKKPTEWSWDGVWEVRVTKCVNASISESVLYGKDSSDDLIHFLQLDHTDLEKLKQKIEKNVVQMGLH